MFKRLAIAAALATSASAGFAQTVIGDTTLIDTATVISGTVTPTTFLTYVSGSNGTTGNADGTTYSILSPGLTPSTAMSTADHLWAQFDAPIIMNSLVALSGVIAIPAIDHGWTPTNTGGGTEPAEPFEFRIWGCGSATFSSTNCELGHITKVWTKGVDNVGAMKNADDWTTQWEFNGSYNYFAITSGDRLVGGGVPGFSPDEGEIDALAAAPIPEPETYALFAAGLAALGFMTRRRRERR
jgi:hypothetical protein